MASFLRISIKGLEKVLKNLDKERENQIKAVEKAHTKVATEAVRELKQGLSYSGGRKYPMTYSPKGQLPYLHTGQLRASIGFMVARRGKKVVSEVGSAGKLLGVKLSTGEAPYAKYLEGQHHDGIRPFLWYIKDTYTADKIITAFYAYYKPIQGGK